MKNSIVSSIRTTGKSKQVDDYNILEDYLNRFKEDPSISSINYLDLDFFNIDKIRKELKKSFPSSKILFKSSYYSIKYKKSISRREVWLIDNGYIMDFNIDRSSLYFQDSEKDIGIKPDVEISDFNNILMPTNGSINKNNDTFNKIIKIMEDSYIDDKNYLSSIGMVAIDDAGLYVKNFNLENNIKLEHMDLHYGHGFIDFDKNLIKRLKSDNKGLVLLHGEPGTGKCVMGNTKITVRDKKTKEVKIISISELM